MLDAVLDAIKIAAAHYPLLPGLLYTSPYDFLAQHGRVYPATPWTGKHKRGVPVQCYGNAIALAVMHSNLKYIEGAALAPTGSLFLHGWNEDEDGALVDSTWCNTGLLYLGVEFSVERADDATWNGDAHILNDENRNYPIFQQRWCGEDYTRVWPESDRIEAARQGKLAPSVQEWLESRA